MDKKARRANPPATPGSVRPFSMSREAWPIRSAAPISNSRARRLLGGGASAGDLQTAQFVDITWAGAEEDVFFAGGGAAGVWAVLPAGVMVEQRSWNSALALVS